MKMMVMKMMLAVELCLLQLVLHTPLCLSDVVDKFDNNHCLQFFAGLKTPEIPGVLEDGEVQDKDKYKLICQKYVNDEYDDPSEDIVEENKKERFATLYDTHNKIPVFSAYIYKGKRTDDGKTVNEWRIEEQLGKDQATDADYKDNNQGLDRGHIFPDAHGDDVYTAQSTYTLTNIVPQISTFNQGSWRLMEETAMKLMNQNCNINQHTDNKAYVITGAVPSTNPENEMKKRVNIPKFMWTAYCCKDNNGKWVSKAHWAENKEEKPKAPPIKPISLSDLYNIHKDIGKLFPAGTCV